MAMFLYLPSTNCRSRGLTDSFDILRNNFFVLGNSGQHQEISTASWLAEILGQFS